MTELSPMGPGFFIFFQDAFPTPGGGYGDGGYELYEDQIRRRLDEEKKKLLAEQRKLKKRLAKIEPKKSDIRHKDEIELQYLLVSESLLQIKKDLAEINVRRAKIKRLARIMREDEEILWII